MSLLLLFNQETEADVDDFIDVGHLQVENSLEGLCYLRSPEIKDYLIQVPIKSISFSALELTASQNTGQFDLGFPSMDCLINAGDDFNITLPEIAFESNAFAGKAINSQITIPNFLIELSAGSDIQLSLESFTCSIQTNYNAPATCDFYLPSLELLLAGRDDPLIDANISIPRLNILLESINISSDLKLNLKPFFIGGDILPGNILELEGSLPVCKSIIESRHSGSNELVISLNSIQMQIDSGEISSGVLRYIWKRIR